MKGMITRVTLTLIGVLFLMPQAAYACEKCFGGAGAGTEGLSLAMLSLLVMVGVIWGGMGMFVYNMRKRAKMLEPGDWVVTEYGEIKDSTPDKSDPMLT